MTLQAGVSLRITNLESKESTEFISCPVSELVGTNGITSLGGVVGLDNFIVVREGFLALVELGGVFVILSVLGRILVEGLVWSVRLLLLRRVIGFGLV